MSGQWATGLLEAMIKIRNIKITSPSVTKKGPYRRRKEIWLRICPKIDVEPLGKFTAVLCEAGRCFCCRSRSWQGWEQGPWSGSLFQAVVSALDTPNSGSCPQGASCPPTRDLIGGARGSGDRKGCPGSGVPTCGVAAPQQHGALEGRGYPESTGNNPLQNHGVSHVLPSIRVGVITQPCDFGVTSASSPSYPTAVGVTHTSRDCRVPPHVPTLPKEGGKEKEPPFLGHRMGLMSRPRAVYSFPGSPIP